jgi:hypothetical protein
VRSSYAAWHVQRLPQLADPGARALATLGVRGVPTTLLIDPEGREIGRLEGTAMWDSDDGVLLVKAVLERVWPERHAAR